jgi:hypothetical protein
MRRKLRAGQGCALALPLALLLWAALAGVVLAGLYAVRGWF